ncbi:MAG: AmmeMemoRadiSam system radical SAM enzyme [Anaerolineae bacterium]|jgi:pyruvate formate lyase activating enzyme
MSKELTRRELLKATGAGLGVLGGGVLLGRLRWTDWLGGELAPAVEPSAPLAEMHEAMFYETIGGESLNCADCHDDLGHDSRTLYCHTPHQGLYVKCRLCPHGCVISEGARGHCRVRENRGGRLYSLVYGHPCALHIDPIEKKPFYHFLPTAAAFSLATAGCNLRCQYCQNWNISQAKPEEVETTDLPPQRLVVAAVSNQAPVLAYTYSEPIIFYEYMLESARQGRKLGLRNVVISAGYINPEPLQTLCEAVDGIKIDLKGFNEDFYRDVCGGTLAPVLETAQAIVASGTHLEIVNLVVPTLNDDMDELRELCRWLVNNVGPNVPLHFSRFHPQYQLQNLPQTPQATLEQAWAIAREEGVRYAYVGNLPGHPGNNTFCHHCGDLIIARQGFWVAAYHLRKGTCAFCGTPIPGVWPEGVARDDEQQRPLEQIDS